MTISVFGNVIRSIVDGVLSLEDDLDDRLLIAGVKRFVINSGDVVVDASHAPTV